MEDRQKKLEELYANKSRHSQYQILASNVEKLVKYNKPLKSKYEKERLDYIMSNVEVNGKKILDIGGNTGYFTFECCNGKEPSKVDYYEGNKEHAQFVELASDILGLSDVIKVHPEYFMFDNDTEQWDVVFFLNVIHHIGFDFEQGVSKEQVKSRMLEHINGMAKYSKLMVFQMGFNWYGNIEKCLFEHGTKKEMEDYIIQGTKGHWKVDRIGIATKNNDVVRYENLNEQNNIRMDALGEFLNRPIFIMRSELI